MYNRAVDISYETDAPLGIAAIGPYRETDYWNLPDEPRCELLHGRLVVTPSPSLSHQRVLYALVRIFHDFARSCGGEVFFAPLDVRLADHSIVQPDLIYVSPARSGVLRERIFGAPDLLVEVLSPSTASRDLGAKLQLYAESGVVEYWIVDPTNRTFEFLENDGGTFRLRLPFDGLYRSARFAGLEADIGQFWHDLPG